jgi:hypothetical protein
MESIVMSTVPLDTFLEAYLAALMDRRAAVFAGAGLSMPAGYVNWMALLRPLAEDVGLDVTRERDFLRVAQYAINEAGGRARVNARLVEQFALEAQTTVNHQLLARLPIDVYWTTNYDNVIEDSLRAAGRRPDLKHAQEQLTTHVAGADVVVYKMHGDHTRPDQCVIAYDDYEAYEETRGQFIELLRGSLVERTFLFLGCSFSDPNIDYVLGRLRMRFGGDRREHFWITRRSSKREFKGSEDYAYARGRDDLRMRDLQRYGIQTIEVASYEEVTGLLEEIARRYRRQFVFVSGAAHDYAPLGQGNLETLTRGIGQRLALENYTLISGGGLGIGTAAVLGAASELPRKGRRLRELVKVTAFDQTIEDAANENLLYQEYREQMLSEAGFAVFLAGNKLINDEVVPASGVENEFQIGMERGVIPIPVGATGHVAASLWRRVRDDPIRFFGDTRAIPALDRLAPTAADPGSDSVRELIDAVFSIIHLYDGRRRAPEGYVG